MSNISHEAPPGVEIEYKVVGMRGSPRESGIYGTVAFGDDALAKARNAQYARGGTLMRRYVTRAEWEPMPADPRDY